MSSLTINGIKVFSTVDSSAPIISQPKGLVCPLCGHTSDQKGLCKVCRSSADMTPRGSASTSVTPSFATHRLVDGNWVPKGAPSATPQAAPTKPIIGFIQPAPQPIISQPKGSVSYLGSRKEYLRAIEIAAGKTLLAGVNQKAIDAIRRGRLGGRKDNMSELHALLQEYSS